MDLETGLGEQKLEIYGFSPVILQDLEGMAFLPSSSEGQLLPLKPLFPNLTDELEKQSIKQLIIFHDTISAIQLCFCFIQVFFCQTLADLIRN